MPKIPKRKRKGVGIGVARIRPLSKPPWGGPAIEGISQSLLSDYLACKERFRVRTIDGLQPADKLNVPIEFGQMWHLCEEYHAAGSGSTDWLPVIEQYAKDLCKKYRSSQKEVLKWFQVCRTTFPIYVKYWDDHPDVLSRVPLFQERCFKVRYELPSGRFVILRGKWDSVDLIENEGIFLQENKTKTKIDVQSLERQLTYDLQTMIYLIALDNARNEPDEAYVADEWDQPICGVRYNVIKRPLAGGKGSIRPHKRTKTKPAETESDFYNRLSGIIKDDPKEFFRRWKVSVSTEDITRFKSQSLDPILENLSDDYEWWCQCKRNSCSPYDGETRKREFPHHISRHFRLPYGVYNVVSQGGFHDLDNYLNTGSKVGLSNSSIFFPELEE